MKVNYTIQFSVNLAVATNIGSDPWNATLWLIHDVMTSSGINYRSTETDENLRVDEFGEIGNQQQYLIRIKREQSKNERDQDFISAICDELVTYQGVSVINVTVT